ADTLKRRSSRSCGKPKAVFRWLICVGRFQLWGTCRKQAFDGNSGRTLKPVLEPLQGIHFLVQDGDDNREVNDYPEDVVMLAPMDADLVRQLRQ
ncbi:MAG: hypothetical protein NWQ37_02115, partial [Marivita lacus]|nr:hypothetical protein [Marivita lacus]